jgi:hypothetical protein
MARDDAYYEAEKKIRMAQLSGEQKLSLDDMRLNEIPESLGQLKQLQILDLSSNDLTSLPESLGQLTQLQSLDLSRNQLVELPNWLGTFAKLQSLDVSHNSLVKYPTSLGNLTQLSSLDISGNELAILPEWLQRLTLIQFLNIHLNQLTELPEWLINIKLLQSLNLSYNKLTTLPEWLGQFSQLQILSISNNHLSELPESIGKLAELKSIDLVFNNLSDLPGSLGNLTKLQNIELKSGYSIFQNNPLNPELAAAYIQGIDAVKAYLRAKAAAEITLNESKLILIGEGEVGKSCLLGALRGEKWVEGLPTTHGIEIKPIQLTHPESKMDITLNGWDFGGQRVYRPTHQLFFSAPAVYLVVWKPREGSQQGFVREWIQLVKHREPDAKILVVATHGGPQQRQPDIDRQELWDLFGKETVVDFFFVDSKPDKQGNRKGIDDLKRTIARVAMQLPEVGRSVPKSFQEVRAALLARNVPYLPLDEVIAICRAHKMDDEIARLYLAISHRLGHLTHYQHDPALRDIVILRPDWLATAISYILDDETTREAHGLVRFSHLAQLWNDPARAADARYPAALHPIFLRLMERFDLSYRVADIADIKSGARTRPYDQQSLIAQLVPNNRPENFSSAWISHPSNSDPQQTQICRIVDEKGNTAAAEGLFYQLIVRLHKYSLGRTSYKDSVHWQRGLVLDDDYNGRALLEHKGNDVHITVRAPYPERFLAMLTEEVKYLVESFWEGLRCDVMVPCLNQKPCSGLFEVRKLIENKKRGRPEQPCPICNEWQNIDNLLNNAPAATKPISIDVLEKQLSSLENKLDTVDINVRRIYSQADKNFDDLLHILTDEAKEGPRLFSLFPLEGSRFNPKNWVRAQFRLVLWCEHARLPLPVLNHGDMKKGVYDLELEKEWFKKAAPYLKLVTSTLSLVLPVASSALKVVNDAATQSLQDQIGFGKDIIDALAGEGTALNELMGKTDATDLERGVAIRGDGATLRELQSILKAKDPGFGGLVRVLNKRQEFLWVHEQFAGEY